jgi:hypothetical protein
MTFKNLAIIGEKVAVALIGVLFIAVLGVILLVDVWLLGKVGIL